MRRFQLPGFTPSNTEVRPRSPGVDFHALKGDGELVEVCCARLSAIVCTLAAQRFDPMTSSNAKQTPEKIVSKRTDRDERPEPDLAPSSTEPISVRLQAEVIEGERKRALVVQDVPKGSEWELFSDEGPGIGGEDTAPEPLTYMAAAVAFCHLTQMSQFAKAHRLAIDAMRVEQEWTYELEGSWRAATREGSCKSVQTRVQIESQEDVEIVRRMVATAERACFAMQALARPVSLQTTASLNGAALVLDRADDRAR